jgi:hypothetical protein
MNIGNISPLILNDNSLNSQVTTSGLEMAEMLNAPEKQNWLRLSETRYITTGTISRALLCILQNLLYVTKWIWVS